MPAPHLTETARSDISSYLYFLTFVKYTEVASATWLLLEILATLPDEVALVWSTNLSLVNIAYIFNKYSSVGDTTMDLILAFATWRSTHCAPTLEAFIYWYMVGTLASEFMMIAMTVALWEFNKYAKWLLVCGALELIGFALFVIHDTSQSLHFPLSSTHIVVCIPDDSSLWPAFLCAGIGETTIAGLTFLRWYVERPVALTGTTSSLFHTLYRDGIVFHFIANIMSTGNIIVILFAPPGLKSFLRMPLRIARSTLTTRLLLNVRSAAAATRYSGSNISNTTPTILFFTALQAPSQLEHGEVPSEVLEDDETCYE